MDPAHPDPPRCKYSGKSESLFESSELSEKEHRDGGAKLPTAAILGSSHIMQKAFSIASQVSLRGFCVLPQHHEKI